MVVLSLCDKDFNFVIEDEVCDFCRYKKTWRYAFIFSLYAAAAQHIDTLSLVKK